jgi:transcriptional regulator
MYIPEAFRVDKPAALFEFIERYNFATIVSAGAKADATHLPFLLDIERGERGTLLAHFARANPHWKTFSSGGEALVIFQGPHCYLSPSWYPNQVTVPTWAYAAVHVRGPVRLLEKPSEVYPIVERLVQVHEHSWDLANAEPRMDQLLKMTVGFEIEIESIEGKFKFNQNTAPADQRGVIDALSGSSDQNERAVAAIMTDNLARASQAP